MQVQDHAQVQHDALEGKAEIQSPPELEAEIESTIDEREQNLVTLPPTLALTSP